MAKDRKHGLKSGTSAAAISSAAVEISVSVVSQKEEWSSYTFSDGTEVRIRPVVIDAKRVEGQYSPDGAPIYNLKATLIFDTIPNKRLMRK
jgi:hypothetical protein